MSLQGSRILKELHPWLRIRIEYLEAIVNHFRGVFIYLSGFRTEAEQIKLMRLSAQRFSSRPVAGPGCSQHNHFGPDGNTLAVDVGIAGPLEFEQVAFTDFNDQIDAWARQIGLTTVRGDSGHFQVFPGREFRTWSVASGFCDPARTLRLEEQFFFRAPEIQFVKDRDAEQLARNLDRTAIRF